MKTNAPAIIATGSGSSRRATVAAWLLVLYGAVLAGIAFWPVPVDRGAWRLLRSLAETLPWLTYSRVEFCANVLMFVPFGVLVAVILRRRWFLAAPIALAVSSIIELGQELFLADRTSSVMDIVANVLGASLGMLLALLASLVVRNVP